MNRFGNGLFLTIVRGMNTEQKWRAIPGYEGRYEVSDRGEVRSIDRFIPNTRGLSGFRGLKGVVRKSFRHPAGYMYVALPGRGYAKVHHLVLEAFVGPRPEGMVCCHANDIADDNRLENLRWDTPSSNSQDKVRNGRDPNARKTHCPQDHEYTPENTRILANGGRRCRTCIRAQSSDHQKRHREAITAKRRRNGYAKGVS